jgi:apolipoprotein D and lipocalin family protein
MKRTIVLLTTLLALTGCTSPPKGVTPVTGFDLDRYLGQWYEIARLDHSFERGLEQVTATYSRREDGGVKVLNRGYDPVAAAWREAEGRAYFKGDSSVGHLKVSFFGPFYGGYVVVALDQENYNYALVSGPDRSYLWILARTPTLDPEIRDRLVAEARRLGYPVDDLIWVRHPE